LNLGLAQTVSDDSNSHEAHHSSIDLDTQQLEVESHDTRDDDDVEMMSQHTLKKAVLKQSPIGLLLL
jgi:hypothetical protein